LRQEATELQSGFTSRATHTDNRPNKDYSVATSSPADCRCHPRM